MTALKSTGIFPRFSPRPVTDWTSLLLETDAQIDALLADVRRVAVLGIKPQSAGGAAYYVPAYAQQAGLTLIPVPVYFPDVTEILGEPVQRDLRTAAAGVDLLDVFRRPTDIPAHVGDILAARPRAVWFQLGIRNDAVAETLARAGIPVVQDRCLKVELQRNGR